MFVEKLKNYFELVNVVNEKAYTFKKTFDNGCYAEIVLIGPLERRNIRFWYFAELNVYDEQGKRNPDCFRKGYASEAMSQLLKAADDVDERLELSAYPQDNVISLKDLMDFYKDNMFKVRYGQEMYRDPLEEKKRRKKRKKAGSESSKESSLRDWFKRKGAKGKKGGWVDCNAPDGKGGYKSCGRSSGEKRKKYPACRPTPGACKERGRGKSWGKKGSKRRKSRGRKKRNESMEITTEEIRTIILEELQNVLDEKKGKRRVRKKKAKKKSGKQDACYHKVKRRYKVWPSAYASGALTRCRKVGAKNWGNKSKKKNESIEEEVIQEKKNCGCGQDPCKTYGKINEDYTPHDMFDPKTGKKVSTKKEKDHVDLAKKGYVHVDPKDIEDVLNDEGGASGLDPFLDELGKDLEDDILQALKNMPNVGKHKEGDYILDDEKEVKIMKEATYEDGSPVEAEYRGRKVKLNKPMRGDVKKFKVYVKDPKTGNIKKVNFGHGGSSAKRKGEKTMRIRKSNKKRRKSFRARHNCDNPGPKTKARYWSCRKW